MSDITKYLKDYVPQEKKVKSAKKRSKDFDNTEIIDIDNINDNEIISEESEEELCEETTKTKIKTKKNKYLRLEKSKLKWNPNWLFKYPWLYTEKKDEKDVMFCKICKDAGSSSIWTTTGSEWLKEDCIERHQQSKKHKNAINSKYSNQLNIKEGFKQQMSNNQALVVSCMRNVYYLTQHNIALNNYESLCDLVTYQIENQYQIIDENLTQNLRCPPFQNYHDSSSISSTNNYALYKNAVAGKELLFSIFTIVEESVIAEVKESPCWSLLVDESNTNVISEKTIALVSKHLVNGEPVFRFLGLAQVTDASANGIMDTINHFITQKGLGITKLRHFGSDGAATMTGIHNGVATQLKKNNSFITSTHCVAHRLHLASEEAAKETPYFAHYKMVVKGIYSYFSNSYKRMYELKKIKEDMDVPDLTILNICDTRWLSWSNVINNFHQIIEPIQEALRCDYDSSNTAKFLYDAMDTEFLIVTKFFADIFFILKKIILVFQSDHISLSETRSQLVMAYESITSNFIGSIEILPKYGTHLRKFMEEMELQHEDLPGFIKQYAERVIANLRKRFPNEQLYYSLRIFDPREMPLDKNALKNYGEEELLELIHFYGKKKRINNEEYVLIDGEEVKKEWDMAKNIIASYRYGRELKFTECWYKIFTTTHFRDQFPNLTTLVDLSLIIPFSNAVVERVFSRQNLIKTNLRNRMHIDTLNMHLHVSLNAPQNFDKFNYIAAYNHWASKDRAI